MWTQEVWDLLKFNWERTGIRLMNPVTGACTRMGLPCKDGHISIFLRGGSGAIYSIHAGNCEVDG